MPTHLSSPSYHGNATLIAKVFNVIPEYPEATLARSWLANS